MQLVDTHVHINFDVFAGDLEEVARRWQEVGVVHLVHSCVEPHEFEEIKAIADHFPQVSFAVGLHPLSADQWSPEMSTNISRLAQSDSRVVAIGETGLDFCKAENRVQQKKSLLAQLNIAHEFQLPVIVHCREAALALKEVVEDFWQTVGPVKGVMHCWGGTPEETDWFLELGFYISFSGVITFKNAETIHESAKRVPSDRLLVETDCPFLAPVPKRGKRNEPAYVLHVAERLAQLRQVSLEDLARQTTENAYQLFNLPRHPQQVSIQS
jgi:TatD DNase family protein